jgi:hypothetical protein
VDVAGATADSVPLEAWPDVAETSLATVLLEPMAETSVTRVLEPVTGLASVETGEVASVPGAAVVSVETGTAGAVETAVFEVASGAVATPVSPVWAGRLTVDWTVVVVGTAVVVSAP